MITLTRLHPAEPLLKPRPLNWEANGVLNPGVTIFDGKITLLYRAVGDDNVSRLGIATSTDGRTFTHPSDTPVFVPDPISKYEERGVEDPRITYMSDGRYAIVYVAASLNPNAEMRTAGQAWKTRVSLAFTHDFQSFERRGVILHSYNDKDAALFPVKWPEQGGEDCYYLYHRRLPSIWLSKSIDLNTWEDVCQENCMLVQPDAASWDNDRIGVGAQPIYTDDGWLIFYHGRDKKGAYRLGAFLADLAKPEQIIAKLPYPILSPELPFEVNGPIPTVVFTCGAVEAGEHYWVYYGGADFAIGGAYIEKKALLDELKRYMVQPIVVSGLNAVPQTV